MVRFLSVDKKLWIPVVTLLLVALGILFVKVYFLKFSLLPSPDKELWLLECRVRFETPGGPLKAVIRMPSELPGYFLTGVSTTPGFHYESQEKNNKLIATWTGNADAGTHTILYQMRLIPELYSGLIADSMETPEKPVWEDGITEAAAKEILKIADPKNSLKPDQLVQRILTLLHNRNLPSVRTLLPENRLGVPFVKLAEKLLAMRKIPARLTEGVFLVDGRRRQTPSAQLEVYFDKQFFRYDPLTGKQLKKDGFLPLVVDGDPILEIQGARNSRLTISVLKTSISAASLNQLRGNLIQHSWLLDISGFNLPLEEQNIFKRISLLPLAILVIVLVRNVIGLQTMGTFMPVLIAFAFLETGLTAGIPTFLVIMTIGLLARAYLTKLNLLLVPRISAVVILVILLMKMLSILAYTIGINHGSAITFFPLIIIAWTIERASMIWDEDGAGTAIRQLFVSLLATLPCYALMNNATLQYFFFSFPEMNLVVLAVILLIGVYTGYRLTELKRFQTLVSPCSNGF